MKKAFTLIELVISIFLLGLIVYFLYSAVANLQKSNRIFEHKSQNAFKNQKILSLLEKDIFYAKSLNISGHQNTLIHMQTANTIFDIDHPYVTWFIKPDLQKLVRFESTLPFKNMNVRNSAYYHMSIISKECEKFKIHQSKKKDTILIYLKFKDEEPLVFEFYKPLQPIKKKKKSTTKTGKNNTVPAVSNK